MIHRYVPMFVAIALMMSPVPNLTPLMATATASPVSDMIGVVKVSAGEPILLAYWQATTGFNANFGIDQVQGIQLAIADKGTVAGFPIRLIGEDSGCTVERGVAAARKLASNPRVVAVIGSTCSSEAQEGAPILWKAGIVTVSGSNTAVLLTDPKRSSGLHGYLRTAHNDKVQGAIAARFTYLVLGKRRAATVDDGGPYSVGLAGQFAQTFKQLGGAITAHEKIAPLDMDMRPVLSKIAEGRPEVIFYPVFIESGEKITRQAKEIIRLRHVILMGADGLFSSDFLKAAGSAAQGMYLSSPDLTPEGLGPGYTRLLEKYVKRFGGRPTAAFHAHAYDAAMLIFRAIEKVATKDRAGNLYVGRKALRDALFATRNYHGVTGTLNCDPNGDCADPKIAVYQVISADPSKWDPGADPKKVSR